MHQILAGIETEYGLLIEGRTAEDQVEDAKALVRSYSGECLCAWDARWESPRADLRGFTHDRLAFDPADAAFDAGRDHGPIDQVRSDRILANGARLYNDHGHPEYATPECWSDAELALQDHAGESVVRAAAREYSARTGRAVRLYKNNTDGHGASYGTHENYLVPREVGYDRVFEALVPMLVARTVLCGAGKVGAERGAPCAFQMSQRADFFTEVASADTLDRRPVFNTRDEPHADPRRWMRVHVICGDANMMVGATERKVGLAKLALALAIEGAAPSFGMRDPVASFQRVSRDGAIAMNDGTEQSPEAVIEAYCDAGDRVFGREGAAERDTWRALIGDRTGCPERFAQHVDWAAKRAMLEDYRESEGVGWDDPLFAAFDLEYHNIDPEQSLFAGLQAMGRVPEHAGEMEVEECLRGVREGTRALVRGLAVRRFPHALANACWRTLTLRTASGEEMVDLDPGRVYGREIEGAHDVESFVRAIRGDR